MRIAPVRAEDVKLPPTMTFTAYDTGTAGFNIAVAVGKMLKDKYGTDLRVLPAGNDVARLAPLRAGRAVAPRWDRAPISRRKACSSSAPRNGDRSRCSWCCPRSTAMPARSAWRAIPASRKIKHLKGKRVGFVVGSPALNQNSLAMLAFGGLKQSDVKIVEFSSYGAMWKGIVNNDVDAAFATTITGPAKEAETSPRGIIWPPLPHRRQGRAGSGCRRSARSSSRISPPAAPAFPRKSRSSSATIPIRSSWSMRTQPADQVYAVTKAMIDGYDAYKDAAPGAGGLAPNRRPRTGWCRCIRAR